MKIGYRIKKLRTQQKITLKELGEKTGLTTSFLSQLERDLTSPSFTSLGKIAEALNTTMIYFFEGEEHKKWVIVKRGTVKRPIDKKKKLFCETLASGFLNVKMQPHIFTIGKGGELAKELIYPEGEGFGMVLKGRLDLACSDEKLVLDEGDSIYCNSIRRLQKVTNIGDKDAELLWIIFRTG
ncbi:MAG: XRE family transcriptional regulator [bacterium]|nr:XRE family transcriptional regulator [bacterium]